MYCPKCKWEYIDGIVICPDCNEKLVDQLTEDFEEIIEVVHPVKVKSVANELEAELIINLLHENNIPCIKKSNGAGGYMNIYMGYSIFGEEIYVAQKDYQVAMDLLSVLSINNNSIEEEEKEDFYHIPFYKNPQIVARILLFVFVGTLLMTVILNNI